LENFPRFLSLSISLMLFLGWFGHNLFRYNWVWYAAFLIIARECVRQRVRAETLAATTAAADQSGEDDDRCQDPHGTIGDWHLT
jgi:hypothetical protein